MLPFPMAFIRKTCVGGKKVVLVRTLWYLCVDNDQFWQIAKNLDFMFIFWNGTKNAWNHTIFRQITSHYHSISRTCNIFGQNENITLMKKLQKGSRANIHFFRNCWPTFKASGLTGWWYDNHKGGYLDIFTRYFI